MTNQEIEIMENLIKANKALAELLSHMEIVRNSWQAENLVNKAMYATENAEDILKEIKKNA